MAKKKRAKKKKAMKRKPKRKVTKKKAKKKAKRKKSVKRKAAKKKTKKKTKRKSTKKKAKKKAKGRKSVKRKPSKKKTKSKATKKKTKKKAAKKETSSGDIHKPTVRSLAEIAKDENPLQHQTTNPLATHPTPEERSKGEASSDFPIDDDIGMDETSFENTDELQTNDYEDIEDLEEPLINDDYDDLSTSDPDDDDSGLF